MNRSERRKVKKLTQIPERIKEQRENMSVVIVTAAIATLAEDFDFTQEQLDLFNEKLQERATEMASRE